MCADVEVAAHEVEREAVREAAVVAPVTREVDGLRVASRRREGCEELAVGAVYLISGLVHHHRVDDLPLVLRAADIDREGGSLFDARVVVAHVQTVAVRWLQLGVTRTYVVDIRYVDHILQLRHRGVRRTRVEAHHDAVLHVDLDARHHRVGDVVEGLLGQDVDGRIFAVAVHPHVLVVDLCRDGGAVVAEAEARADTLCQVVGVVAVRVLGADELVVLSRLPVEEVRQAVGVGFVVVDIVAYCRLRMAAYGLGVGDAAVETVIVVVGVRLLLYGVVLGLLRIVLTARVVGRIVGVEAHVKRAPRLLAYAQEVVAVDARIERAVVVVVPVLEQDRVGPADGEIGVERVAVAPAVVERQLRTHHQSLPFAYAQLRTGIEVVVAVLRGVVVRRVVVLVYVIGIRLDLLLRQEVVAFGPAAALVVAGVVCIATLELETLVLTPCVYVVYTAHTHARTAVSVHVVGTEAECGLRLLAEEVQVAVRAAVVLRPLVLARLETVEGIHLTEDGGLHLVVGDDIDGLVAVAVVDAREFGLVAQLVEHLNRLHGLGRYGLYGRSHIVAEELAAVDKDLLHGLALNLDRPAVNLYARHLREQLVGVGVRHDLIRRGVVDDCVAVDGGAYGLRGDVHRLDTRRILLHGPCRHVEGLARLDLHLLRYGLVAEERRRKAILTRGEALELIGAAYGRRGIFAVGGVAHRHDLDDGAHDALLVGIDNRSGDGAAICLRRCRNDYER